MIIFIVAMVFIGIPFIIYSLSILYVWALAYSCYRDDEEMMINTILMSFFRPWMLIRELHKGDKPDG